jgi:hypothetical protein
MAKLTEREEPHSLEAWDSHDDQLEDCWNCGGEGYVANCFSEYACLYPDEGCDLCTRRCDVCRARTQNTPDSEKDG